MNARKCNPCEAISIVNKMGNISLEINCYSIFMPDRNQIFYNRNLFRNFDEKNFGVGYLCVTRGTPFDQHCGAKRLFSKIKTFSYFLDDDSDWWRDEKIFRFYLY
jgi:hypothetical protein